MRYDWILPTLIVIVLISLMGFLITLLILDAQATGRLKAKYFEKRVHLKGSPSTFGICTGVTNSKTLNILILGNPPTTVQVPEGAVVMEVE